MNTKKEWPGFGNLMRWILLNSAWMIMWLCGCVKDRACKIGVGIMLWYSFFHRYFYNKWYVTIIKAISVAALIYGHIVYDSKICLWLIITYTVVGGIHALCQIILRFVKNKV